MVSVSLLDSLLHFGQGVSRNFLFVVRGFPFPNSIFSGSIIGRSFSGTGTAPQLSQYIIGIGVPQYLCLLISQSLNLYCLIFIPIFNFARCLVILSIASLLF